MIPRGVRSKDMIGMKVRTTREIRNKAGICIPKGTIVKIVGFGRCFSIETKKCTKCGLSAYIRNITRNDVEFIEIDEKITNADRIRNMTDEELADFLLKVNAAYSEPCMTGETDCKWEDYPTHDKGCKDCLKEWLESAPMSRFMKNKNKKKGKE